MSKSYVGVEVRVIRRVGISVISRDELSDICTVGVRIGV